MKTFKTPLDILFIYTGYHDFGQCLRFVPVYFLKNNLAPKNNLKSNGYKYFEIAKKTNWKPDNNY